MQKATTSHGLKGAEVRRFLLELAPYAALVMHTGAAIGAQIGATPTEFFHGVRIRLAFVPLPLIGAGLIIYGLITGHHLK
jgi:hypothetical protein